MLLRHRPYDIVWIHGEMQVATVRGHELQNPGVVHLIFSRSAAIRRFRRCFYPRLGGAPGHTPSLPGQHQNACEREQRAWCGGPP
jgi:hypothetical protein